MTKEDVQCSSNIKMADDYGDNHCTVHCERGEGHAGKHREYFESTDEHSGRHVSVIIEWLEQDL